MVLSGARAQETRRYPPLSLGTSHVYSTTLLNTTHVCTLVAHPAGTLSSHLICQTIHN